MNRRMALKLVWKPSFAVSNLVLSRPRTSRVEEALGALNSLRHANRIASQLTTTMWILGMSVNGGRRRIPRPGFAVRTILGPAWTPRHQVLRTDDGQLPMYHHLYMHIARNNPYRISAIY